MFLVAIVLAPFITIIPSAATAPALIFLGVLMMGAVKDVDFGDMTEALPAFCTMVFMPFTYSIANGIAAGLITYILVKILSGRHQFLKPADGSERRREINIITVVLAFLFVIRFAFMVNG